MRDKLQAMIAQEHHKQPLTDTELCKQLSVSREYVTLLRKELNILDSRERKKSYICEEIGKIFAAQEMVTERELLELLRKRGYTLSKYLLDKYLKNFDTKKIRNDILIDSPDANSLVPMKRQDTCAAFDSLVGVKGSLDMQIQQAKATMLYPPHGLHCLIIGETGVGKSELAECMHKFALESGCLPETAPFIIFNCADYAENSQLLITQLFGCTKGAYTGAVVDRKGLIEQTDGGILFLDEVHRLSSEGQEMLFQLIDKGIYRKLGESDAVRTARVQLIAATTENIETSLLATFKRRIPMLIHVPSLYERPLAERLQLIHKFFGFESSRMNAPLQVALDVIKAYLLYDCRGNIGQLKSDIQVTCAKSFLSYVTKKEAVVHVDIQSLGLHVKKGLMQINTKRNEIDSLVWNDFKFNPGQYQGTSSELEDDLYSFPKDYYGYIEQVHTQYLEQGMDIQQIRRLIGGEIEKKLQHVIKHVKHRLAPLSRDEISKVVGSEIISLVQEILEIAEAKLGKMHESIFYCLAIHLNATFSRLKQGRAIINPNLEEIKNKFNLEYGVASEMVAYIKKEYAIELPEDEIGYITLYLHGNEEEEEEKVGVVVATHGNVGGDMLEIACKLLNINHGQAFNMRFEESPQTALAQLIGIVQNCDAGKGVLMLVDMGSLLTFGEMIQERTRIHVETIDRVDTVMVIEALRRSILPGSSLEDVIYGIENLNYNFQKTKIAQRVVMRKKAIITICFTGEGVAFYCMQQVKRILSDQLGDLAVLHMGMIGKHDIDHQIQQILMKYEVMAVVGSVDPKLRGIPYFTIDEILSEEGERHLRLAVGAKWNNMQSGARCSVPEAVEEAKILLLEDKDYTKEEILQKMCRILREERYVKEGYEEAVFEREKMGSYLIHQRVALPHADSSYVNRPVIFLARVRNQILWDGDSTTRIICLLALDIHGKDGVRYLYKKFQDDAVLTRIEQAETPEKIREVLTNGKN